MDMYWPIVTYLRRVNRSAQRTRQLNPFAAAGGDKKAMRSFVKML